MFLSNSCSKTFCLKIQTESTQNYVYLSPKSPTRSLRPFSFTFHITSSVILTIDGHLVNQYGSRSTDHFWKVCQCDVRTSHFERLKLRFFVTFSLLTVEKWEEYWKISQLVVNYNGDPSSMVMKSAYLESAWTALQLSLRDGSLNRRFISQNYVIFLGLKMCKSSIFAIFTVKEQFFTQNRGLNSDQ